MRVPTAVELLTPYADFVAHITNDPGMIALEVYKVECYCYCSSAAHQHQKFGCGPFLD